MAQEIVEYFDDVIFDTQAYDSEEEVRAAFASLTPVAFGGGPESIDIPLEPVVRCWEYSNKK